MQQYRCTLYALCLVKEVRQVVYFMIPFTIWHSGKAKVVTRNGPAGIRGCGWEEEEKGAWGTVLGGIRSVLCLDFGGGYMAVCMHTNS